MGNWNKTHWLHYKMILWFQLHLKHSNGNNLQMGVLADCSAYAEHHQTFCLPTIKVWQWIKMFLKPRHTTSTWCASCSRNNCLVTEKGMGNSKRLIGILLSLALFRVETGFTSRLKVFLQGKFYWCTPFYYVIWLTVPKTETETLYQMFHKVTWIKC